MNICKPKLPVMFQQKWSSARDSALVHTAGLNRRQGHPDDRAPALFTGSGTHRLLIPDGKERAARPHTLTGDLQEEEGIVWTIAKENFTTAFMQTIVRVLKICACIANDYVKKN